MTGVAFDDLVPIQQEVANLTNPTALILGGAGVGKTTTALWAARRELVGDSQNNRIHPGRRVLFVTFSRTAVSQIRSRSTGVLAGLADSVEVSTFHGLAFRLIGTFGRYLGMGSVPPTLQGEARQKLLSGGPGTSISYAQLLPSALRLLETPGPIADLLRARWSLVICDEFQDTDDDEWRLLQRLGESARLLLLADPNQMIYGFKSGVTDARLDAARARPDFVEHTLPPGSHRDPTQVLPDAATEVRWRRFTTTPVVKAIDEKRLVVYRDVPDDDEQRADVIVAEVNRLRAQGHKSIGIYAKTNNATASMSFALVERGLEHVPIGLSEAYGEALATMHVMVQYARGAASWAEVRTALGVTLTASVRSPRPPSMAIWLRDGHGYPETFGQRLTALDDALKESGDDIDRLLDTTVGSWPALGFLNGQRPWARAGRTFRSALARTSDNGAPNLDRLSTAITSLRDASFVELDSGDNGAVQLMNFSQTKGREADATILSYTSDDYYGRGGEPFDEPSRILYVSMTRARHKVVIMLPPRPHDLVAPFVQHAVPVPG